MLSPSRLTNTAPGKIPSYRYHKASGQAVVTLNGHEVYLGKYGTKRSRTEYDRVVSEWLVGGRTVPRRASGLTVAELVLQYWRFAKGYYSNDGRPTGSIGGIRVALRHLRGLYGHTLVADFGPLALEAIQLNLVRNGLSRSTVNEQIACIRRAFRWGVAKELVPPTILQALQALPGLRKGRSRAREPVPVRPVTDEVVEATLRHLPVVVADMVRFQRLTGCRPAEVCILRPCDVDTSGEVWSYRPQEHKTEYLGRERVIFIGPKAQALLRPYLLRENASYCFVPAESEKKRRAAAHARRRTPLSCGNRPGTNRRGRPKRFPGDRYTTASYRRAIDRAVELANRKAAQEARGRGEKPPAAMASWSPNRLRHTAATEIRRRFGLEAAQVTLGHATADVSQIYAERDWSLAAEVMRKIG